jgi:flagellar export protein FliJ
MGIDTRHASAFAGVHRRFHSYLCLSAFICGSILFFCCGTPRYVIPLCGIDLLEDLMAFHFPLETLLRLRHSLERKERMALEDLARRIAAVRLAIAEIELERRAARALQSGGLTSGLTASEMHFAQACEENRETRQRRLTDQLVELEKQYRRQQAVFIEARQKREILENLRDRQETEYRREWDRREQQGVDDLFLMRAGKDWPGLKEPRGFSGDSHASVSDLPGDPASVAGLTGEISPK